MPQRGKSQTPTRFRVRSLDFVNYLKGTVGFGLLETAVYFVVGDSMCARAFLRN